MRGKKIAVIYHGNCPDGFGGAWAAWLKFRNKAEYIGATDRANPPIGLTGKKVYFIDWVYPEDMTAKVMREAEEVIVIDHHATSEAAARMVPEHVFDTAHSAAVLAWQYFHPKKAVPKLLKHIEDYDLWKYELRDTKILNAYITSSPFEFKLWNKIAKDLEKNTTRKPYLMKGESILQFRDRQIADIADNAELVEFFGHQVLAVNSPVFQDQLGNILAERMPPFSIVWRVNRGKLRVSLRSIDGFNISGFAQRFGGGGHPQASGFTLSATDPIPWKRVEK